jgi:large conductance mechanosensitive channel
MAGGYHIALRSDLHGAVAAGRTAPRSPGPTLEDSIMLSEFKAFLMKHGVIGLAVAVVIGGAVGKLVTALVNDLVMPVVGALTPSGDWRQATWTIGSVKFGIGDFVGSFIDFVIIAFVVFMMVKVLIKDEPKKE